MHIFFCGIGGSGLSGMAHLALDLGFMVSGSDVANSENIEELKIRGAKIFVEQNSSQNLENLNEKHKIDWFIQTAAIKSDHVELQFAQKLQKTQINKIEEINEFQEKNFENENQETDKKSIENSQTLENNQQNSNQNSRQNILNSTKNYDFANFPSSNSPIKISKRDEFINFVITQKNLKLIAVAGTHGKTTTTGMLIWLFRELGIAVSYLVGSSISFGKSATWQAGSEYFVLECDEFDRNFLKFTPQIAIITSLDYDHPDSYPTESDYYEAFRTFCENNSELVFGWQDDLEKIGKLGWLDQNSIQTMSELQDEIDQNSTQKLQKKSENSLEKSWQNLGKLEIKTGNNLVGNTDKNEKKLGQNKIETFPLEASLTHTLRPIGTALERETLQVRGNNIVEQKNENKPKSWTEKVGNLQGGLQGLNFENLGNELRISGSVFDKETVCGIILDKNVDKNKSENSENLNNKKVVLGKILEKVFEENSETNYDEIDEINNEKEIFEMIDLVGLHNRQNAFLVLNAVFGEIRWLVMCGKSQILKTDAEDWQNLNWFDTKLRVKIAQILSTFPGTDRRFQKLAENIYTDYAHHPSEIAATLQLAQDFLQRKARK